MPSYDAGSNVRQALAVGQVLVGYAVWGGGGAAAAAGVGVDPLYGRPVGGSGGGGGRTVGWCRLTDVSRAESAWSTLKSII